MMFTCRYMSCLYKTGNSIQTLATLIYLHDFHPPHSMLHLKISVPGLHQRLLHLPTGQSKQVYPQIPASTSQPPAVQTASQSWIMSVTVGPMPNAQASHLYNPRRLVICWQQMENEEYENLNFVNETTCTVPLFLVISNEGCRTSPISAICVLLSEQDVFKYEMFLSCSSSLNWYIYVLINGPHHSEEGVLPKALSAVWWIYIFVLVLFHASWFTVWCELCALCQDLVFSTTANTCFINRM